MAGCWAPSAQQREPVKESASGVERALCRVGQTWIDERATVVVDGFEQHSEDPAFSSQRFLMQVSDEMPTQSLKIVAMDSQHLAGTGKSQLVFCGLQQATIQTFVMQVGAGKLLRHPLDRPCASIHDHFDVRILAALGFSQTARLVSSLCATRQHYPMQAPVFSACSENSKTSAISGRDMCNRKHP